MDRAPSRRRRAGDLASVVRPDSTRGGHRDDAPMSPAQKRCRVEEVFGAAGACPPGTCALAGDCAFEHVEAVEEGEVFDALVEMRRTVELLRR